MQKYIWGFIILLAGVYFLLENLGYHIGIGEIIRTYWPLLIVIYGLKVTIDGLAKFLTGIRKKHWVTGKLLSGVIILGIGITLLGNNLEWFDIGVKDLWNITWPVLIIFFGLSILFRNKWGHGKHFYIEIDTDHKFDRKRHVIGESRYGDEVSWNLNDIHLWHGIGETYINLSTAIIPDREVYIDVTGIIGEVTVLVPYDLPVKVNVDVRIGDVTVFNHNQSGTGRFISYTSEDYEQAIKKVNIMISLSIGEVTVKQVD